MILTGNEIAKQVAEGRITISPFNPAHLTTNSYDFHLGDSLLIYTNIELDVRSANPTDRLDLSDDGLVLQPNRLYLGHTVEVMGSAHYVPIIRGKSSTGRLGLFVHITADLIDIGSINQYTLMLHATQPVRVYPGMQIGQVTFWRPKGPISQLYDGMYNGLAGPQASQIYKDFSEDNESKVG